MMKSSGNGSKFSGQTRQQDSKSAFASASTPTSSKRRSEAIRAVPELEADHGKSYEMKQWNDVERGPPDNNASRGSEEGILESQAEGEKRDGIRRLWEKITSRGEKNEKKEDMTITRTSEVELQISPASDFGSKRSSRQPPPKVPTKNPPNGP
jgi:hypothetical protein